MDASDEILKKINNFLGIDEKKFRSVWGFGQEEIKKIIDKVNQELHIEHKTIFEAPGSKLALSQEEFKKFLEKVAHELLIKYKEFSEAPKEEPQTKNDSFR